MNEKLRAELIAKREELKWKNNLRSLEIINWIEGLLKEFEEPEAQAPKEVIVDLPDKEPEEKKEVKKPGKTQKIVFKKK